MSRTLIIGDVHGCIRELDDLLAKAALTRGDRVVLVGDLVAKGPDSRAVVRRARELDALAVRGNHDHYCIAHWEALRRGAPPPKLGATHRKVVSELDEEDFAWLAALPYVIRFPEHASVVVHAGFDPRAPIDAQRPEDMLFMRSIREDGSTSSRIDEGVPWATRWRGPETVYFGHDAIRGLQLTPHAIGLDTGCVYGRELTGWILPEGERIQVKARKAYSDPKG